MFRKGCKPNSVFPRCRGERAISLSDHTRDPSRDCGTRAGHSRAPYLTLLPTGFSVPPCSHRTRWALTPPFHPYHHDLTAAVRRYVLCGTFRRRNLTVPPPERIPGPTGVARRRALRSSDFPPPAFARSDSPPFRNAPTLGRPSNTPQAPSPRFGSGKRRHPKSRLPRGSPGQVNSGRDPDDPPSVASHATLHFPLTLRLAAAHATARRGDTTNDTRFLPHAE